MLANFVQFAFERFGSVRMVVPQFSQFSFEHTGSLLQFTASGFRQPTIRTTFALTQLLHSLPDADQFALQRFGFVGGVYPPTRAAHVRARCPVPVVRE